MNSKKDNQIKSKISALGRSAHYPYNGIETGRRMKVDVKQLK